MTPGGRIAIVEVVLGELSDPGPGALIDMNMLAVCPGQERSLDEYDALLAAAGLGRTTVLATHCPQRHRRDRRINPRPADSERQRMAGQKDAQRENLGVFSATTYRGGTSTGLTRSLLTILASTHQGDWQN
jgi:hypothetical protein